MSKRKAVDHANAPPALRNAAVSPAAAAAAGTVVDSSLRRAQLAMRRAAHTFRLAELLRSNKPIDEKLAAVAASILEDAARPEPLIHLSMQFEGYGTLLMLRIDALAKTNEKDSDTEIIKAQKRAALSHLSAGGVWPHIKTLVHSYDVHVRRGSRTTLHIVAAAGVPDHERDWPYRLAQLLLRRGADPNAAASRGMTPLHVWAWNDYGADDRACGLQLLLEHGADPNVQNEWGNSLLHQLVRHANERPLRHLAESGLLSSIDPFVVNTAGLTPLELARQRKAEQPDDPARATIRSLVEVQEQMWASQVRPFVSECVAAHLIPDLSAIVLAFVDGEDRA